MNKFLWRILLFKPIHWVAYLIWNQHGDEVVEYYLGHTYFTKSDGGFRWWWHMPFKWKNRGCLNIELSHQFRKHPHCLLSFCIADEPGIGFSLAVPFLFYFHIAVEHNLVYKLTNYFGRNSKPFRMPDGRMVTSSENREVRFAVHDWSLWWEIWRDSSSWDSGTPKWRSGVFHPLDALFGRMVHEEKICCHNLGQLNMPEMAYQVLIEWSDITRYRKRWKAWPFLEKYQRSDLVPQFPIPHPGKGENSYDCGEDATFSMSCQADSNYDALNKLYNSVMRSRERHGNCSDPMAWRPEEVNSRTINSQWADRYDTISKLPPAGRIIPWL